MSNHIADANKMVDTPRMNSVAGHARGIVDAAIFAEGMKLERELNAANDRIKRLEEESESRWMLAQSATGSCAEMSSRIKRLEDAGDELLRDNDDMSNINRWWRAKEAKP